MKTIVTIGLILATVLMSCKDAKNGKKKQPPMMRKI